jgi:hypothetical protein
LRRVEREDDRRDLVLVGEQVDRGDDLLWAFGDDPDDELVAIVDGEAELRACDGRGPIHQRHGQIASEGRRLDVQDVGLVGLGRRVHGDAEAGLARGPTG